MSEITTERENPLLQIDTSFRTYLNAYTRSYQDHMVNGVLDYAFESDFAVRQKIMGLGGWGKLYKAAGTQDVSAEAKHLFLKCDQVGPLKYPDIYDIVKKCAERLELVVPIVFVRGDMERAQIYSVASDMIEPCIVLSKQLVDMCTGDELMFLIGCECGRIQNNHCAYNMAFTYLNYNKYAFKPVEKTFNQTVSNQLHTALVQWVRYADITANRAGIICLDRPGLYISVMAGLYAKGYIDFYGRSQKDINADELISKAESIHSVASRNLKTESGLSEIERLILAANEFLYCTVLGEWRGDAEDPDRHLVSSQICDVRSAVIIGNGGNGGVTGG